MIGITLAIRVLVIEFERIIIGSSTWETYLELIFRTVFMYLYSLFLVRVIGKRGLATLAPFEMAMLVVLGSVLADPMMNQKVPLLNGMLVLTIIVILQRLFVHLTERNVFIENLLESHPSQLVSESVIKIENLHKEGFSREDLFLNLREKGIEHLGEVKCAFLETSGRVSVWCRDKDDIRPGLSVFPEFTKKSLEQFTHGRGYYSCLRCGFTRCYREDVNFKNCENCKSKTWVKSSMLKVPEDLSQSFEVTLSRQRRNLIS